jgi:hypothetical protein
LANGLPTGCGLAARTKPARICMLISRKHDEAVFLYCLNELLQHSSSTDIQILNGIKIKQKRKIMMVNQNGCVFFLSKMG